VLLEFGPLNDQFHIHILARIAAYM
jgi:hypothetical protein